MTTVPEADALLGGRYRLTERIAGGGMGEVWRALDQVLGREVAVKVLRREYASDPTFLARFRAEARHSANLVHSGIAAVYDFSEGSPDGTDACPFLVMEHVPGEPLSALIGREGPLPPDRTLDIVAQAADGLQAAHAAGVIHRDVKPGNLMVTPTGVVKITDFGISRATNSAPLTQTGAIMGTADYISPEQASGSSVTPASDIYSLGVVAYECLTGRRPFAGDTPVSVALAQVRDAAPALPDTVPGPVRALVMRMLAKEPTGRPASAGEVAGEARDLRGGPDGATAPTVAMPVLTSAAAQDGLRPPAAPDAGSDTTPGFRLPAVSGRPAWLPYAVALAVFGLLLVGLRACADEPGTAGSVTGARETADSATAPTTVEVAGEDYLGRPEDEVRAELTDLGLRVEVARSVGGGAVGTVKGVSPTGTVRAGRTVTLAVVAAPPPVTDDDEDEDRGRGRGADEDRGKKDKKDEKDKRKDDQ